MFDPDKFRRELKLKGMSLKSLSDVSGMNYAHLSNLRTGKIKDVKFTTIKSLAEHLGIPTYRLLEDPIIREIEQKFHDDIASLDRSEWVSFLEHSLELSQGSKPEEVKILQKVPIVGEVHSEGRHTLPMGIGSVPTASLVSQVPSISFPNIQDVLAYAVLLNDPELGDEFRPGTILIVSPSSHTQPPDLCLVGSKDGRIWIRHAHRTDSAVVLVAGNADIRPILIAPNEIRFIHPVVGQQSTV